ncbi:golgi uridine diphosphate-N- acetylglucosamine transporter, partial [Loxospora ochrophaea]|nr:golgi uridine diphosphate-N- acetylglucosamine transporter [Loxospora ochrophaea]
LLITLTQFLVTALFAWPAHFSASRPPFFLKPRAVPLVRWLPNIVLFFTVNMLNNFAFGYDISVPVHIILRSGGSVTTIVVGFLWGKRFTRMQVFSVAVLTIGVIIAAMADAQSKGKDTSTNITANTSFMTGLVILFLAQLLSAIMGLYTQATYTKYGPHWNENLFYSHFLSLPLFIPFLPSLRQQLSRLLASPAFELSIPPQLLQSTSTTPPSWKDRLPLLSIFASDPPPQTFTLRIPKHLLSLALNSLTQYACIRGVNLLAARTTALGVTIVLNIRKLVSLFASIWLFGNKLPPGVLVGAAIVFGAGGVYAWEGQRISKREAERKRT